MTRRPFPRRTPLVLVTVVALALGAACGGDDTEGGEASQPTTATSEPAAATTDATVPTSTVEPTRSSAPAPTSTVAPTTTGVRPEGFATARVEIRRADGTLCELCTYLAATDDERRLGLMQVTDLAGLDGMIFEFERPGVLGFWMKNTVMPLSAAWFGPEGDFVGAFDMTPCPPEESDCPTYGPSEEALHVLEVPQGDLERLGIGPGSRLESVGEACEAVGVPVEKGLTRRG